VNKSNSIWKPLYYSALRYFLTCEELRTLQNETAKLFTNPSFIDYSQSIGP